MKQLSKITLHNSPEASVSKSSHWRSHSQNIFSMCVNSCKHIYIYIYNTKRVVSYSRTAVVLCVINEGKNMNSTKEAKHKLGEMRSNDITVNFVVPTQTSHWTMTKNGSLILPEKPSAAPEQSLLLFSQRGTKTYEAHSNYSCKNHSVKYVYRFLPRHWCVQVCRLCNYPYY